MYQGEDGGRARGFLMRIVFDDENKQRTAAAQSPPHSPPPRDCYPLMPRQSQISRFNRSRHSLGHRLISSSSPAACRDVSERALLSLLLSLLSRVEDPPFPVEQLIKGDKKRGLFSVIEREPTGQSRDRGIQGETRSTHWMGCDVCLAACKSARTLFNLRLTLRTS